MTLICAFIVYSCLTCRRRKIRCSGEQPGRIHGSASTTRPWTPSLTILRQSVRLAWSSSMSASATPIPLPTCDRNPIPHPAHRPLLWLVLKKPANVSHRRWRAVPQSPHRHPYPGSKPISPRKRRNNWKMSYLPGKLRRVSIRKRISLRLGIAQRVVSLGGCAGALGIATLTPIAFAQVVPP